MLSMIALCECADKSGLGLELSLSQQSRAVSEAAGSAREGFGGPKRPALPSKFRPMRILTLPVATGNAIADISSSIRGAKPCAYRPMPTRKSSVSAPDGNAITAIAKQVGVASRLSCQPTHIPSIHPTAEAGNAIPAITGRAISAWRCKRRQTDISWATAMAGRANEASGSAALRACRLKYPRTDIWTREATTGDASGDSSRKGRPA
jgi:hypothetical protein